MVEYGPKKPDDVDYLMHNFQNGKGRLWKPLSEDNWREELNQIPLFMDRAPTQEDVENNPTLQAIQSLVYEGTPEEIAMNFKEQGNDIVRNKQVSLYSEAKNYYTRALEQKCGNSELELACLINRAYVNLELTVENYRSVINDCTRALRTKTEKIDLIVKALFRLSTACIALEKYDEAMKCILQGLSMDPENSSFEALKEKTLKLNALKASEEKENEEKVKKLLNEKENFLKQLETRGVSVLPSNLTLRNLIVDGMKPQNDIYPETTFELPNMYHAKIKIDGDLMVYPVVIIYPKLETFDMVLEWYENVTFKDQLDLMFEERPDFSGYAVSKLSVYVPGPKGLQRFRILSTLSEVVRTVPMPRDLMLRCFIVPTADAKEWISSRVF